MSVESALQWVIFNCSDEAVQRLRSRSVAKTLAEEITRLRAELKRIETLANCGSVDSWMSLSDQQKREWFAVTLHVDSEKAKIIREQADEIERLREEVQRLSARLIEERHAAEIAWENTPQPTASADAKCRNDGGNCGAGGYCDDCHQPSADAKDAEIDELKRLWFSDADPVETIYADEYAAMQKGGAA